MHNALSYLNHHFRLHGAFTIPRMSVHTILTAALWVSSVVEAAQKNPFASITPSKDIVWSPCYKSATKSVGNISCARLLVRSLPAEH